MRLCAHLSVLICLHVSLGSGSAVLFHEAFDDDDDEAFDDDDDDDDVRLLASSIWSVHAVRLAGFCVGLCMHTCCSLNACLREPLHAHLLLTERLFA